MIDQLPPDAVIIEVLDDRSRRSAERLAIAAEGQTPNPVERGLLRDRAGKGGGGIIPLLPDCPARPSGRLHRLFLVSEAFPKERFHCHPG